MWKVMRRLTAFGRVSITSRELGRRTNEEDTVLPNALARGLLGRTEDGGRFPMVGNVGD
jgi:hypothetical protein